MKNSGAFKSSSSRHRRSIRLMGYDYTQAGAYFVTICTADRRCILGDVVNGVMRLSAAGKIVETCWTQIPNHFPNTNVHTIQIMPNHVHGIIQIKESPVVTRHVVLLESRGIQLNATTNAESRRGLQLKTPTQKRMSEISAGKGGLAVIVRTFKGAVTSELRRLGRYRDASPWQRNYYEHIIRDNISHFFVEQYIELNPVLWELDSDNPRARAMSFESMESILVNRFGLMDQALRYVFDLEFDYWSWRKNARVNA